LREKRRVLSNVSEMGCMSSLVHEGVQGSETRANGVRVGKGSEVGHSRYPSAVRFEPSWLRPVAEPVRVFVLAVKKI